MQRWYALPRFIYIMEAQGEIEGHFENRSIFISQSGKSNLVCPKALSSGDVLISVNNLHHKNSDDGSIEFASNSNNECNLSDPVILHRSAGVICKNIVSFISDCYPTSGDLLKGKCLAFVSTPLIEFNSWCTSEKAYENITCNIHRSVSDNLLKTLTICHNIIVSAITLPPPSALV